MEHSPLRYLDYDMSLLLSYNVRISKENITRKFHSDLFEECVDLNKKNHYLISNVFDKINNYGYNDSIYPNNKVQRIIYYYELIRKIHFKL